MPANATLLPEFALRRETGARLIAGIDEVGRGALAGPVSVGVVVMDLDSQLLQSVAEETGVCEQLDGVRDSKLLSAVARNRWQPQICDHAQAHAVEHRSAEYIDRHGITAALRDAGLAGLRAVEADLGRPLDMVILDGTHDWLTGGSSPRVRTMRKADTLSLTVACASVLAKVERDKLMTQLAQQHPVYGWDSNKGYGSANHRDAIQEAGVTAYHRRSWNLGLQALPGL
ncbi:ribonuclease HII [Nesterenkonia rhizosphaerae]|uniref:Ribonuclease n=1 Tax=Nesterenkonia rhizosphaerae TaxID=1348272 RepID=A0ABP9G1S0_9MICC